MAVHFLSFVVADESAWRMLQALVSDAYLGGLAVSANSRCLTATEQRSLPRLLTVKRA